MRGVAYGWGADAMAQLSVATLTGPELETAATMVGGGDLQLWNAEWADVSILANPREVKLNGCSGVEDLSPVADVRGLVVSGCHGTRALPAMRNDVLEVGECKALTDVSGLGGGRVGRLELRYLLSAENVGSIGAMQVPLRTVVVEGMHTVQDVSMVAGVCGLEEVIGCPPPRQGGDAGGARGRGGEDPVAGAGVNLVGQGEGCGVREWEALWVVMERRRDRDGCGGERLCGSHPGVRPGPRGWRCGRLQKEPHRQ